MNLGRIVMFAGFLLSSGFVASASQAAPAVKFSCDNVGGTDEWTIYVDLEAKKAGFFDNDSTALVPFKTVKFLESRPPQTLYIFEGADSQGGASDTIRIAFNQTKKSASITFNLGQQNERTLKSENGCSEDTDINLD
jgi:hypothetical protein